MMKVLKLIGLKIKSDLKQKEFFFYGLDNYAYIFSYYLFVSQEGSKIILLYDNYDADDRTDILGPILLRSMRISLFSSFSAILFFIISSI